MAISLYICSLSSYLLAIVCQQNTTFHNDIFQQVSRHLTHVPVTKRSGQAAALSKLDPHLFVLVICIDTLDLSILAEIDSQKLPLDFVLAIDVQLPIQCYLLQFGTARS